MLTRLLEEPAFTSMVKCLIYDEAHFIVTSGLPDKEGNVFRSEYAKGYEVRLRLHSSVPCALFSATLSKAVLKKVLASLRISDDPQQTAFIFLSTNRKNLCYAVKEIKGSLANLSNLDFMFPSIVHPPMLPPKKTLIFVPTTQLTLEIESYLQYRLPQEMVARLHASRTGEIKKDIIADFCNPEGNILVLVTTTMISNVSLRY